MGIKEDIQEIKDLVIEKKGGVKEKKFKFPFGKKVGRSQRKKNYVTVLLLSENGTYIYKKYQIIDQTIIHNLIPRLATAGLVMFDKKGNPLLILPNWSVEPFSPKANYEDSLIQGTNTTGYRLLLDRMENSKTDVKKKIGNIGKVAIGLVVGAIILYALVSGGGA